MLAQHDVSVGAEQHGFSQAHAADAETNWPMTAAVTTRSRTDSQIDFMSRISSRTILGQPRHPGKVTDHRRIAITDEKGRPFS